MATFNTVWSLDIGRSSLKAVRLRRERNNIEILEVDKIDYPTSSDGVEDTTEKAKEALVAFRSRNEVRDPVILAHNGQGTLSRFIRVPASDPKKLVEMVGYEAAQQIPFPLDEVIWDYHVIDRDYQTGEEREVGVFAARRDAIEDYLLDYESEGLDVEGVAIGYLGLLNYILFDIAPEEPTVFLDIGASHTDLILVDGQKFWTRALPHSGNEINKSIMDRFRLNFGEAEKIKIHSAKNQKQAVKIFQAVIQPKLRELVNEIHRSIGYYRSQSGGEVQFKHLYLLGNGSKILGIKKFLEEALSIHVTRLTSISRLRISRDANLKLLQQNLPAFATAFGCALQGVGVGSCRVDLMPKEEKLQKEFGRKKKHVYIALAILYLITIFGGMRLMDRGQEGEDLNKDVRSFLKPYTDAAKDLKEIEERKIEKRASALQEIALVRAKPPEVLDVLAAVLEGLKNDTYVTGQARDVDPDLGQELARVRVESEALLNRKVWIPHLAMEKVRWPDDDPDGAGPGRARAGKVKPNTVPALKVTIFAVVKYQDDPAASLKLLTKNLITPIELELKSRTGSTLDTKVTRGAPRYPLDTIFYDPKVKPPDGVVQEGGPFYGTRLTWYMRVTAPLVPEEDDKKDDR